MAWKVLESKAVKKQVDKIGRQRPDIKEAYEMLIEDLKEQGPEAKQWPHFGKLVTGKKEPDMYHCHLNKGTPRYVAVWRVNDYVTEILEVRYAGTHEGADYKRIR